MTRIPLMIAATVAAAAVLAAMPAPQSRRATATAAPGPGRLTNLAHLDFLGDRVAPPQQARHTTYRIGSQPEVGVLWTYAEHQDDGSYKRVGGGTYHADTDTYGQGAFNADDMREPPWSTCATGGRPATRPAGGRPSSCCAASPTCRPRPARTPATWCSGSSPTAR